MSYTPANKSEPNIQKQEINQTKGLELNQISDNRQPLSKNLTQLMATSPRHEQNRQLLQKMAAHSQQLVSGTNKATVQRAAINSSQPIQFVITRSMQKIIDETEFKTKEDYEATAKWLMGKYSVETVSIILGGILDRQHMSPPKEQFTKLMSNSNNEENDADEVGINEVDHGDLSEYDNAESVDSYIFSNKVAQLARKGDTVSGPKSYTTSSGAAFNQVAYKTDGKGCINFSSCHSQQNWSDPVLGNSEVDLSKSNQTIDTKNRAQHFAIGDFLYAKSKGSNKASDTTNMRKGKWTWHHLPTPYKMVLVDMTVHAKHGHNGGVYLW